jgi:hypothetical protein
MYKIAVTDENDKLGFVELLETMAILQCGTFQESKAFKRVFGLVQAYSRDAFDGGDFKGMNRALPVNQAICPSHSRSLMFECRWCGIEFPHHEYATHLVQEHDDIDAFFICHNSIVLMVSYKYAQIVVLVCY